MQEITKRKNSALYPPHIAAMFWFVFAAFQASVWAAPIQVDTTAASAPGACTLASAVKAAKFGSNYQGCLWGGEATIQLAPTTYRVDGQIFVSGTVTILGNGATIVRDDPAVSHRFFGVSGSLYLSRLTLSGGEAVGIAGGAIAVVANGELTASACTFEGNTSNQSGGAIYSYGTTVIRNSTFSNNSATSRGGAVYVVSGLVSFERSLLNGNSAYQGGAIYAKDDVAVDNTTFSANTAQLGGAMYQEAGTATVVSSTFKDNTGSTFRSWTGATIEVGRSALADSPSEDLCVGSLTSLGDNAATDASCGLAALSDQQGVAIPLSDLVEHGGMTQVHAPRCDSSSNGSCVSPLLERYVCDATEPRDQRGQFPRYTDPAITGPKVYPDTGPLCDIGAYESSCQSEYWFNPGVKQNKRVRLYRYQSGTTSQLLDNGACYAHQADFDDTLSGCSLEWEIYGGTNLEVRDVIFIDTACVANNGYDCFEDAESCALNCGDSSLTPAGWFSAGPQPGGMFRFDVPSCTPPSASLRYVIAYANTAPTGYAGGQSLLSAPGETTSEVLHYWDPQVDLDPPNGSN